MRGQGCGCVIGYTCSYCMEQLGLNKPEPPPAEAREPWGEQSAPVIDYAAYEKLQLENEKLFDRAVTAEGSCETYQKNAEYDQWRVERLERDLAEAKQESADAWSSDEATGQLLTQARAELAESERRLKEVVEASVSVARKFDTDSLALRNKLTAAEAERDLLREMFNEWRAVVGGDMLADGFKKAIGVGPTMLREMRERQERYRAALEDLGSRWRNCTHNEECDCMELKDFARDALK